MAQLDQLNGTLTPPSLPPAPSPPSAAKRKRADTALAVNGAPAAAHEGAVKGSTQPLQEVLEDIIEVLQSYDTQPSILNLPIKSSTSRSASGEATAKRSKLTPSDNGTSVHALVRDGAYDSLDAFAKDAEQASEQILASVDGREPSSVIPISVQDAKLQTRVLAFQKRLQTLVLREQYRRLPPASKADSKEGTPQETENGVNGNTETVQLQEEQEGRHVLTLFGQAQGPKQLFSSLQQPVRIHSADGKGSLGLNDSVEVTLPLRESTLPNIISTTEVFPLPDVANPKPKKVKTFGELFPAPANLPQLSPPKPAKQLTTRGSSISFVPQDSLPKNDKKGPYNYATQNLTTGQWLGYGGVDMPKDPTSPTAKQKSRQRALSTGEAQLPPSEATLVAVQQAKEDALFRSVYSSFAPSRDDAAAIIPEETKNKVWWQRIGQRRYEQSLNFAIDPALEDSPNSASVSNPAEEEQSFKDAVDAFTPVEDSDLNPEPDNTVDGMLKEISELIETLASHQRIRNKSLATNPRTPVIQNASLANLAGSPATPSAEEIDVYQMLKSQLALMISALPPYAVAKLNGDQLAELNISRTILIETEDCNGVLEEDQASKHVKVQAASAVAGPPSLARMSSGGAASHSHYPSSSTQYTRATPSAHTAPRPVQASQSYYSQQPSLHRSPSLHYQRSSSGPSQSYSTPAPYSASAGRSSFPATQAYGQQAARQQYSQSSNSQYYPQRPPPSGYGGLGGSQYYSTPQAQSQSRYPQQTQNGYYARPGQSVAPMPAYNAAQSPHMRTNSPLKTNQPPQNYAPRPAYGTPAAGGQGRSSYYSQPGVAQVSQFGTPQPATPSAAAPYQQAMLDRQMQAQPQARLAAQNSFHRQGSGTPQPPNGQYGGQVNGTPGMMA